MSIMVQFFTYLVIFMLFALNFYCHVFFTLYCKIFDRLHTTVDA